jgi:K+-transporting ATPase c subunit
VSPRRATCWKSVVTELVEQLIKDGPLGVLGEPHVNVLELNLAFTSVPPNNWTF